MTERFRKRFGLLAIIVVPLLAVVPVLAKERRVKPPQFGAQSFRGVFFEDLSVTLPESRPSVQELRGIKPRAAGAPENSSEEESSENSGRWRKLASAQSIEDEVKRVKLRFDSNVSQPGAFKSGGYKDARNDLFILATLFGIVAEYEGEIRWKNEAEAARNLMARSAGNCNSGSIQVFNECKSRIQDLDELLGGAAISSPPAAEQSDWQMITNRSVLMEYLDVLSKTHLPDLTNTDEGVKESPDKVKQFGDMVALVGHVLTLEGMDEAEDEEYVSLANQMRDAAMLIGQAAQSGNADAARKAVGAVNQSCDACHEQYR